MSRRHPRGHLIQRFTCPLCQLPIRSTYWDQIADRIWEHANIMHGVFPIISDTFDSRSSVDLDRKTLNAARKELIKLAIEKEFTK